MKKKYFLIFTLYLLISTKLVNAQVIDIVNNLSLPFHVTINNNNLYFDEDDSGIISKIDITITNSSPEFIIGQFSNGLIISGNYMYNADYLSVKKIDLSSTLSTSTTLVSSDRRIIGIALNGNDFYYVTSSNGSSITSKLFRIDINSTNLTPELIFSGLIPKTFDMVFSGNILYILSTSIASGPGQNTGKIYKVDVSDSNPTITEIITGLDYPRGLAINNNYLYFSEEPYIKRINLTETNPSATIIASGLDNPFDLTFGGNDLYFTQASDGSGKISKIASETLNTLEFDNFDRKIYLYPNPADQYIVVNSFSVNRYKIYSIYGKITLNGKMKSNNKIDIQDIENGLYFLQFENGEVLKFIKK